jgi:hypothetical protein
MVVLRNRRSPRMHPGGTDPLLKNSTSSTAVECTKFSILVHNLSLEYLGTSLAKRDTAVLGGLVLLGARTIFLIPSPTAFFFF